MFKVKNNFSKEYKNFLRKEKLYKYVILLLQISILFGFIIFWEYAAKKGIIDPFIFSSPSRIWNTIKMLYNANDLFNHIGITLYETVVGFLLATFAGLVIATILWLCTPLQKLLEPYIVVLNSLPKIALGPILIIWVGSGTQAIIAMCVLITIIITIIAISNAFNAIPEEQLRMFKTFNASKLQTFFKLVLPSSVASLISVLKINVGLSFVGSIMGEYLVSKAGLGYLIVYGGQIFKMDLVMASTVILCVLAGLLYGVVAAFEKYFKRKYNI